MKKINTRKFYYHVRHRYLTTNNLVIAVALFIAASWAWGSVEVLRRNFALQREVDGKHQELRLLELENATLRFQQNYYESDEYKELAVRERLGLAFPGEKALILPPNNAQAKVSSDQSVINQSRPLRPSNTEQWINFLFGGDDQGLQQ